MLSGKPASLVVVGGGGHARVVMEAARTRPDDFRILGYCDPRRAEPMEKLGVPWLGDDSATIRAHGREALFVLGVGEIGVARRRREIVARFEDEGVRWAAVVHASAILSPSAVVDAGAVVMAGAIVNAGAWIREHAVVNTGAIVEHDVVIGAFAQVAPGVALGGAVELGENSYVGLGARVRNHVRVGTGAVVGMGAVVVRSVEVGRTVHGVPARVIDDE
jgi:acetyltransferase EpsM